MFSLFLIVHHRNPFVLQQHKVICKLLLSVVCGRPSSIIVSVSRPSCSLGLRAYCSELYTVFHLLHSIQRTVDTRDSRHTRFAAIRSWRFPCLPAGRGDENCLPPLSLIRSTKLHLTTEPPISCRCCYAQCFCPFVAIILFTCSTAF
jgi:hypothetical protein